MKSTERQRNQGQMRRVKDMARKTLTFTLDGETVEALEGDTVMTAILTNRTHLRTNEFSGHPHAGFCLMGACQDCWVWSEDGVRIRSCSTLITPQMRLRTSPLAIPEPAK
ncbi:(2Fe-2S)-binding protein [Brenneria goodwinii]|uniref:Opine oxidase subunit C n=1 Tax=Brenneria goodwinii TaxID=1109412 RepID=A0A0G4JXZ4_9GAMM|nr:(2Fe-2S)-binding protein [Brenneria goodwinii]CPR18644.1 Opine oxidase subunit C [Brenneria goodwinii]